MVLVVTKGALASQYTRKEWVQARRHATHIMPILYKARTHQSSAPMDQQG